jgi:hypothetical protein
MSQSLTVFHPDQSAVIVFDTAKGAHSISPEGALFKGGKALAALKDAAMDSALSKAHDGKYRAASDILGASYPACFKAFTRLIGEPSQNKANMRSFMAAITREVEPTKGWNKKQMNARLLCKTLETVKSLAPEVEVTTVEMA